MSNPPLNKKWYSNRKKLDKKIKTLIGGTISKYDLIQNSDRILVAISGGKDSFLLLSMLDYFKRIAPIEFELIPIHLNIGYSIDQLALLKEFVSKLGYECIIESGDLSNIIRRYIKSDKNPCSLCSRIKRGVLYTKAENLGCNKLALGHHLNDLIETFLMNTFYNGTIATMPVKYKSNRKGIYVVRPLASVPEELITHYIEPYKKYIYNNKALCPYVKENTNLKRERIKNLINELREDIPEIEYSLFASLSNIHLKEMNDIHLLDLLDEKWE